MKYEIISLQPLRVENSSYNFALNYLVKQGKIRVKFMEFSLFKELILILRGIEKQYALSRFFKNIYAMIKLLFSKNKTIIIGAAPYSIVIFLLNRLKSRHRCIFYASWPYWDGERYPEKVFLPSQKQAWYNFLNGIISAGVTKASCEGIAKYGAKTTFYMPHTIDTHIFVPSNHRHFSDKVKVLYVGKLYRIKGIPRIINLIKNNEWQNIEFYIVGVGPLEKEIVNLQKEQYPVRYLGYIKNRNELVSIYQNSDVLILPSYQENFGIVLIEAMACQLPVIATDCAGPREIVEDGVNGMLIPQDNEEALRDAVLQLANSPELRDKYGVNGRKKVENMYDVKEAARRWLEIIEMVHTT
jgi:glycosyltransferase involved in cell wall biosynthesis